jgi:ABC-type branched-subunit amino acid transport system ATPase component
MLSIDLLSYSIGGFRILNEVGGAIEAGEVVALVGPNGAGKTTLADIISGFRRPSHGRVLLTGIDITGAKPHTIARLGISRMFQGAHLAWNLTAQENILASLVEAKHFTGGQRGRGETAMLLLERVGLLDRRDELARRLSFGQQRLLALARALAKPAQVLVLDEPFSGLKGAALEQIMALVLEGADSGKAILIIDHLLSALRDLNCRFWYLAGGRLTGFSDFGALAESELFHSGYGASIRNSHEERTPAELDHPSLPDHPARAVCRILDAKMGYNGQPVISGVNLSVYSHEAIAIVGLNGVGKSTLLRAIAGTCQILEGQVELFGEDMTTAPVHERIRKGLRVLPQEHRLFRGLSIRLNRALASGGVGQKAEAASYSRSPNRFLENRAAGTFSGGEQASAALELLDIGKWSLALLDEPTTGLDGAAKQLLGAQIQEWLKGGKSVVFIEHDFDFVVLFASRIYIATTEKTIEVRRDEVLTGHDLLKRVLLESGSLRESTT